MPTVSGSVVRLQASPAAHFVAAAGRPYNKITSLIAMKPCSLPLPALKPRRPFALKCHHHHDLQPLTCHDDQPLKAKPYANALLLKAKACGQALKDWGKGLKDGLDEIMHVALCDALVKVLYRAQRLVPDEAQIEELYQALFQILDDAQSDDAPSPCKRHHDDHQTLKDHLDEIMREATYEAVVEGLYKARRGAPDENLLEILYHVMLRVMDEP